MDVGFEGKAWRCGSGPNGDHTLIFELDVEALLDDRHIDICAAGLPAPNTGPPDQFRRGALRGVNHRVDVEEVFVDTDSASGWLFMMCPVRPRAFEIGYKITAHFGTVRRMQDDFDPIFNFDFVFNDDPNIVRHQEFHLDEVGCFFDGHLD